MARVTTCDVCGRIIKEDIDVICINAYTPEKLGGCLNHRDLCTPCAKKILKDLNINYLDIFKEE